MANPMFAIGFSGDAMRITLDVCEPIASEEFFHALAKLLAARLAEVRAPSPGELEIASWSPPTVETGAPHE